VINSILSSQSTQERGLQSDGRVQAPYLQMVMSSLWQREQELGSRHLRVSTLEQDLKGARHIYESHFSNTLNKELTDEERKAAPAVLARFVTGTGRKTNVTLHDVSADTALPEKLVKSIIRKLQNAMVLTRTPPPKGARRNEVGHEFAHDVLAEAALKYVRQEAVEVERRKAEEAEKRAIGEAQAARRLRFLLVGLAALLIIAVGAAGIAWLEQRKARRLQRAADVARETAVQARGDAVKNERLALAQGATSAADAANLRHEFDLAILLASYARYRSEDFPDVAANAEAILRSALMSVDVHELHGDVDDQYLIDMAWSPDGTRLAGVDSGFVYAWDLRKKDRFIGNPGGGESISWSAGGQWLAEDGRLLDGQTFEHLEEIGNNVHDLAWHPKLPRAAIASEHELEIWQLPEKKKIASWETDASIEQLAWSPDGSRIAATTLSGNLEIWDAGNHRRLLSANMFPEQDSDEVRAALPARHLLWSGDGKRLLTTNFHRPVQIRDASTGNVLTVIENRFVTYPAWSHDGQWLALGIFGSPSIKILDGEGKGTYLQLASPDSVTVLSWSLDDKLLAVSTLNKSVRIYHTDALRVRSKDLLEMARSKVKRDLTPAECAKYLQMQTCPPRP
jgi:hypothetical protein